MFVGSERKISMSRVNLLSKLQTTLADHKAEVIKANAAWYEAVHAFAADLSERVENGDYTNLAFDISKPTDNSKEIERAIAMVECSVENTIILDENTFNQWVCGEWSFRKRLNELMTSASAMAGALRKG